MTVMNDDILDILDQNAKWWEQAAITCESVSTQGLPSSKEEWQLMGAVYRERVRKIEQFIESLRQRNKAALG